MVEKVTINKVPNPLSGLEVAGAKKWHVVCSGGEGTGQTCLQTPAENWARSAVSATLALTTIMLYVHTGIST